MLVAGRFLQWMVDRVPQAWNVLGGSSHGSFLWDITPVIDMGCLERVNPLIIGVN